jgi:hypothetical protein
MLILTVLLTTALCNALSNIGTPEAKSEVTGLLDSLQNLLEAEGGVMVGGKLEHFLAALARARSLRPGPEATSHLERRHKLWPEHREAVLKVRCCVPCTVELSTHACVPAHFRTL